jgi:uncharacterized membrane protein YeaQ/YmgE (transglycosylase-associated protein family)
LFAGWLAGKIIKGSDFGLIVGIIGAFTGTLTVGRAASADDREFLGERHRDRDVGACVLVFILIEHLGLRNLEYSKDIRRTGGSRKSLKADHASPECD